MTMEDQRTKDSDSHPSTKLPKPSREIHPKMEQLQQELTSHPDVESKIHHVNVFMEKALAQEGSPDFRAFWDARSMGLELFKESVAPAVRSILWDKFTALSLEARRLKEILDEQSSFAVEQIEMAISSLETEIVKMPGLLNHSHEFLLPEILALRLHLETYENAQWELNLLNAYASRINAFRKELIKTEMRIRYKNKFFQRLSTAGDHVFPRRKELIKTVSELFSVDIEKFYQAHFAKEDLDQPPFALRDQIKTLQNVAKALTLNAESFNTTRLLLSKCWDQLKACDMKRKAAFAEQRERYKVNAEPIRLKIGAFSEQFAQGMNLQEAHRQLDTLMAEMRATELGREEIQFLRDELNQVREQVQVKARAHEEERKKIDEERENLKQAAVQDLRHQIEDLVGRSSILSADDLMVERDALLNSIAAAPLQKGEKLELEKSLRPLRDAIAEKKEEALLALPADDREALEQLQQLHKQRVERRQQVRLTYDQLRKQASQSGLDITEAISLNRQVKEEKERLDKAIEQVRDIEAKIHEIEAKL